MKVSELNTITVPNSLGLADAAWLDPTGKPFRLYGILPPDGEHDYYHRTEDHRYMNHMNGNAADFLL